MKVFVIKQNLRVVIFSKTAKWYSSAGYDLYLLSVELTVTNISGIIGYAPEFYAIVTSSDIVDKDDDQLFYTKVFLNEKLRVSIIASICIAGDE